MIALRVTVRGRVQGVGFRWHAQRRAQELGVVGWVRNTASGAVEAHLEGEDKAVAAMMDWLAAGPPAAHVTGVEDASVAPIDAESFRVTG